MNSIARHFESLGMTPADAASRAELFAALEQRAQPILDGAPQWRRFTPGRIEIFGKHTDYAGGHSLIARGAARHHAGGARHAPDGLVRVGDIFDGQIIEVDPSTPVPPHYRGLQRYVHVVAHRLFLNFPGADAGRQHRDRQRPAARLRPEQLERAGGRRRAGADRSRRPARSATNGSATCDASTTWRGISAASRTACDFPGLPGSAGVGTHGGSEDHTAILAVRTDHVSLYRFVPVTPLGDTRDAARLDVRDRLERRAGRQGRLGHGIATTAPPMACARCTRSGTGAPRTGALARRGAGQRAGCRRAPRPAGSSRPATARSRLPISIAGCGTSSTRPPARRRPQRAFRDADRDDARPPVGRVAARRRRAARQPDSRNHADGEDGARARRVCRRATSAPGSAAASGRRCPSPTRPRSARNGSAPTQRQLPSVGRVPWFVARPGPAGDRGFLG